MVSFSSNITGIYTVSVTECKYNNWQSSIVPESVNIVVTPLNMILLPEKTEFRQGEIGMITASVSNSQAQGDNTDVTGSYTYEWSISPLDTAYSITVQSPNSNVQFKVDGQVTERKSVTVTAIAKDSGENAVASASTVLNVNEKPTVTKTYQLTANESQTLKFETADIGKTILSKSVYVNTKNSNTPIFWTDLNSIPTIKSFDKETLTVEMSDGTDFDGYDYVMISVELQDKIYNFYVYSVKNNVDLVGNGTLDTYVPGDLDTIRKLSELSSDKDNMQGQRKYSYLYKDDQSVICELRYSIHSCTGVGQPSDSYGKWFMKRNNHYYRYDGEKWVLFHDGEPGKQNDEKEFTHSYWNLKEKIKLPNSGVSGNIQNFKFWQYWN